MWLFIKTYPLKYWHWYLFGVASLVLTTFITTLIPLEIMTIIDAIHQQTEWAILKSSIIKLMLLASVLAIVRTLSRILIFTPGRYVEYDLRKKIHAHLLTLPPSFFRSHTIGDTMSRMINDIQALRLMSAFGLLHIVNTTMIYGLVIFQMMTIHKALTIWVLLPVPFALVIVRLFVKRLYKYIRQSQQQLGTITDFFVESVANIGAIKTYNAEHRILTEMQKENIQYRETQIGLARIRSSMFPFIATIGSIGQIILLYLGGQFVIQGALTIGELVAFSTYLALLAWPTAALSWIINIIQRGLASLTRIQDILTTPSHPQFTLSSTTNIIAPPHIKISNLNFSYASNESSSLTNISLSIQSGQRLGIFGATGSGKSTLAHLISLIEPAPAGTIFFNDIDVSTTNVQSLRNAIALVPQRRFLFSTSILNNVIFSDPSLPSSQALTAAERACVIDDIRAFPKDWETIVGERGIILSGGQQHRLAMARAYASQHHVLVLDDVLSSVDHNTEKQMINALYSYHKQPTTIIISHRISALKECDHIIVLDQGSIIAEGSHNMLISTEGPYKATWEYQQMEASLNE